MEKKKTKTEDNKQKEIASPSAPDKLIANRGRTFKGIVVKKFPTRVVIEFGRVVFVPKYDRFYKKKTRIHARLPQGMEVNVNDSVKIAECRPLSKIIHHVVIEKINSAEEAHSENSEEKK